MRSESLKIETEMTAIAKDLSEIKADVKDLIKLTSTKLREENEILIQR
ncbi:hypothetical protein FH581_023915 [Leptospira weilii]|nr:hypothetical protein [Leptospira weilii]UPY80335.1 hypothetical protein FH581_023915 [Leptospira weilii]